MIFVRRKLSLQFWYQFPQHWTCLKVHRCDISHWVPNQRGWNLVCCYICWPNQHHTSFISQESPRKMIFWSDFCLKKNKQIKKKKRKKKENKKKETLELACISCWYDHRNQWTDHFNTEFIELDFHSVTWTWTSKTSMLIISQSSQLIQIRFGMLLRHLFDEANSCLAYKQ